MTLVMNYQKNIFYNCPVKTYIYIIIISENLSEIGTQKHKNYLKEMKIV